MRARFNSPIARRRRHLRRSVETPLGLDDFVDLDDMVNALCQWGGSQPWVHELPGPASGAVERRFVIDCPVLSCTGLWFAVRAFGDDLPFGPEVIAVLPSAIAHRGVAHGWAAAVVDLDDDRAVATVVLPTTVDELSTLQRLLHGAYSAAFRPGSAGPP